jgi:hypothetical protein
MNRSMIAAALVLAVAGCGKKKVDETQDAIGAMAAVAAAGSKLEEGAAEAARFQKERVAKGDTVAMPYAELQKFLPASIGGYQPREEPSGSQQAMAGFSMSQTERTWTKDTAAQGVSPEIHVSLVDFGGTQQGYAMLAAPMMMGFSQEDAHRRVGSTKIDVPNTGAWEEFDKDSKDTKLTAIARYRFVITIEARNHGADQSAMVKRLAEEIATKFEGK